MVMMCTLEAISTSRISPLANSLLVRAFVLFFLLGFVDVGVLRNDIISQLCLFVVCIFFIHLFVCFFRFVFAGIAKYNVLTDTWHSLNGGINGNCSFNNSVYAIAVTENYVYIAGSFSSVGPPR